MWRARQLSMIVFPLPDGPIRATISPFSTIPETSWMSVVFPALNAYPFPPSLRGADNRVASNDVRVWSNTIYRTPVCWWGKTSAMDGAMDKSVSLQASKEFLRVNPYQSEKPRLTKRAFLTRQRLPLHRPLPRRSRLSEKVRASQEHSRPHNSSHPLKPHVWCECTNNKRKHRFGDSRTCTSCLSRPAQGFRTAHTSRDCRTHGDDQTAGDQEPSRLYDCRGHWRL